MVQEKNMKISLYFTDQLKNIRESKKYSQKQMAELLSVITKENVDQTRLSRWEKQTRSVTNDAALAIADYFEIKVSDLVIRK
jgi:transcriptional regulator with XRE-family HTH domain